jgi:hypothetical protein
VLRGEAALAKPAVLQLQGLQKSGSGFFVTETGVIATNATSPAMKARSSPSCPTASIGKAKSFTSTKTWTSPR